MWSADLLALLESLDADLKLPDLESLDEERLLKTAESLEADLDFDLFLAISVPCNYKITK